MSEKSNLLIVGKPYIKLYDDKTYIFCDYSLKGESKKLWMHVDSEYSSKVDFDSSDPFSLVFLIIAMKNGVDLHFEGVLTDTLYVNISKDIQSIYCIIEPSLAQIKVTSSNMQSAIEHKGIGVGTGFSCGIDSYASLVDNYYEMPVQSHKITHLFQINHNQKLGVYDTKWQRNMPRFLKGAEEVNLPLIQIGSNFYSHVSLPYSQIHPLLNCSVAMLLRNVVGIYYYASGYKFEDIAIRKSHSAAYSDSILLPLLSTRSLFFYSTGSDKSRVEKTISISQFGIGRDSLDVCAKSPNKSLNCSLCYKCKRTMMTLDMLGELNSYGSCFDLSKWKRHRSNYIQEVLENTTNKYMEEIKKLGEDTGYFKRVEAARRRRELRAQINK
ncbi:hypothetical protein [Endozoicomonas lisbonensis]|uniref:Uncharacterized protein n=1 Tax=Endozoicomonas lisbonensis TaxID=3120522 RepID=A0ABV2SIK0_9GAMM